jgi:hypothetical protein
VAPGKSFRLAVARHGTRLGNCNASEQQCRIFPLALIDEYEPEKSDHGREYSGEHRGAQLVVHPLILPVERHAAIHWGDLCSAAGHTLVAMRSTCCFRRASRLMAFAAIDANGGG